MGRSKLHPQDTLTYADDHLNFNKNYNTQNRSINNDDTRSIYLFCFVCYYGDGT
jgi:hypothetical protein